MVMTLYPDPLVDWTPREQVLGNWLLQHMGPRSLLHELHDDIAKWYEENRQRRAAEEPNDLVTKVARMLAQAAGGDPDALVRKARPAAVSGVTGEYYDASGLPAAPLWRFHVELAKSVIKAVQHAGPGFQEHG